MLDAGCGGGTWGLIRPHNCNFVVGNLVHELPFEENSFDFVFMQLVGMGIPNEQYATVLSHLYKLLKPGGWIELVEVRFVEFRLITYHTCSFSYSLYFWCLMDGEQVYRGEKTTLHYNAEIDLKLSDTGYVNINGMKIRIPVGGWGGKLGEVFLEDIVGAYKSLQPVVQPILNYSDADYQELLDNLPVEANEVKQEVNLFMNWAQKPAN
ncbi:hypothetical protein BC943DRAFT_334930 [Umbelopsis sp. AD052]|nr:hypothetical protein BC943DRAFT_334930 [Umbelopsis sp. AD052]